MHHMKDSTSKNLQQKIFKFFDEKKGGDLELEKIKQEHRKEYLKQKHQEYKTKWKKETLRFSAAELDELNHLATKHGYKRAPFLKACIWAYLHDYYVIIDDTKIRQIELSINHIQNIINESLRYIHLNTNITINDIEAIKQHVHNLEIEVSQTLRTPPKLKVWLQTQMKNDENFIPKLQAILTEITHDN